MSGLSNRTFLKKLMSGLSNRTFLKKLMSGLSDGHSRANLASAITRQKINIFGEYSHLPKCPFQEIFGTRQT
jgi:hypothetical protein